MVTATVPSGARERLRQEHEGDGGRPSGCHSGAVRAGEVLRPTPSRTGRGMGRGSWSSKGLCFALAGMTCTVYGIQSAAYTDGLSARAACRSGEKETHWSRGDAGLSSRVHMSYLLCFLRPLAPFPPLLTLLLSLHLPPPPHPVCARVPQEGEEQEESSSDGG